MSILDDQKTFPNNGEASNAKEADNLSAEK
jgi:hypothetical protein